MSKITTEDCKNYIKDQFGLTSTVNIKRDRKYKDANGDVIRVFKFNDETCLIKEDVLGHLSVVNESDIVEKAKSDEPKEFNAKKFIKKNIKRLENDEGDDEEEAMAIFMKETSRLSLEDKVKVANEFYFYFPYETYNNMSKFITKGLDTPMLIDGRDSLCIVFYDSLDSEPDLYVSDILKEILPEYFDKVDEYHFEVDSNDFTKKLSITDMIELLQHYGFTYKNSTEYLDTNGCMLKKLNIK
jgi:hypothetical protein